MTPDRFSRIRHALGLSQTSFGDLLGVGRGSVSHYENGCRHDDGRPVTIPRTVEMACAALILGVRDLQDLGLDRTVTEVITDYEERLPFDEILPAIVASIREELALQGIDSSEYCIGLRAITFFRHCNSISVWATRHNMDMPKIYSHYWNDGELIVIVDLLSENQMVWLKAACN